METPDTIDRNFPFSLSLKNIIHFFFNFLQTLKDLIKMTRVSLVKINIEISIDFAHHRRSLIGLPTQRI